MTSLSPRARLAVATMTTMLFAAVAIGYLMLP